MLVGALPFNTSPFTMSWFWTTAEPDKELNGHGDKRTTPAVMNQESITRDKNSAGKYMYPRGVKFPGV